MPSHAAQTGRLITSPSLAALGFCHGFSTRRGGTSTGAFASLNMGASTGDDPERVEKNRALFLADLGLPSGPGGDPYEVQQVHGCTVCEADASIPHMTQRADAIVAAPGGPAIAVRTADCVPVLLADPGSGAVAAVHSGWRGTAKNVIAATVQTMARQWHIHPGDLWATVGPHIGPESYEVSEEVARILSGAAPGSRERFVARPPSGKPRVNLGALVVSQLAACRIPEAHIEHLGLCTHQRQDLFFSHRRDGARSGRHLNVIVPRATL